MRDDYSDEEFEWDVEHETTIHWVCPNKCGYEYDAEPWVNRSCKCPDCNVECTESGTSYRG